MFGRLISSAKIARLIALIVAAASVAMITLASPSVDARIPPEQIATTEAASDSLVFHHLRRYEPGVELMAERSPELLARVREGLGLEEMPTIDVWVLPRVSDYFDYHELDDRPSQWAVGLSFSDRHEIIVAHGGERAPREAMQTYAHELAHVAVDQARQGAPVPRWFHEGFAVMMAEQWEPERSERLARAAAGESLTPFEQLWHTFPGHQVSNALAYDQSYHFVRWLQQEYGEDLFARVMERIREGEAFRGALEAETGLAFAALEGRWRDSLSGTTTIWSILRDDFTIFFGAALFFIITYIIVRRRRRRQFEAMEREERDRRWDYDESRYPLPGKGQDG